eukprot:g22013.t1
MRRIVLVGLIAILGTHFDSGTVTAESRSNGEGRFSLRLFPSTVKLTGAARRQQILISRIGPGNQTVDVTHHCSLSIANPDVARIDGTSIVGIGDGATQLRVRYNNRDITKAVEVVGFATFPPVHFVNDVIPIFSKLGCNSGGCHGKQSGQNGFRLSVFGSDPKADFAALAKHSRGRRTFPADPDGSLLIRKMIGKTAHGGGRRTQPGSLDHQVLREWVRQGMPWGDDNAPTLNRIAVEPRSRVLKTQSDQQIVVTAIFTDGTRRDVTASSAYSSNAESIAEVDQQGRIRCGTNPGEAAVTVNYMGQVAAVQILVPRSNLPKPYPRFAHNNQIDALVGAKLRRMGIVPSNVCDDATFLRRLHLDAIGTLPKVHEVRRFIADKRPDKRRRAIDAVLDRPEYADYWSLKFADVLMVNSEKLGERGAYQFHRWLHRQFRDNRPYDEWVRELIVATGDSERVGPVNFYRALKTPEDLTRSISQAFLGIRLDCCQCHHHPFEKWGREDFYGLAGFFNGIQRKKLSGGGLRVFHANYRPSKLPLTGQVIPTKPPGGPVFSNIDDGDPRVKLARWITAPENPYFARLAANRLWKHFLGRGLVEPEDDLRSTNPATNEPLLAFLAEQLSQKTSKGKSRFDLKALMRLILQSRVYQLSSAPNRSNADDEQNYSHYFVKRLPAEVLLDAVSQVTGAPETFPGMPRGTRTIQIWDNRLPSYFLDTFGRSERESPCACGKSNAPTMAQALHLMNAPEIDAKLADKRGRIARLIKAGKTRQQIVEELCIAALGRPPTAKEQRIAAKLFQGRGKQQAAEDFLWTLLNSYDFLFAQLKLPPERVQVVGGGYREDLFHNRHRREQVGETLLYAGKFSNAKGLPQLLDVIDQLSPRRPGLVLHVAGTGSGGEAEALRERMANMAPTVVMHGQIDQPRLAELMRESAVFVLPSFYEGLPLVLVEAAASGCRLVTTALPGVMQQMVPSIGSAIELVELPPMQSIDIPEAAGLPDFVNRLATAIDSALNRPPIGSVEELVRDWTWASVFQRVEHIWTNLIAPPRS